MEFTKKIESESEGDLLRLTIQLNKRNPDARPVPDGCVVDDLLYRHHGINLTDGTTSYDYIGPYGL